PAALLQQIVDDAADMTGSTIDEINSSMAMSMARSAAITYGEILTNDEMENLVNELFACENVNYTPDGHPVFAIMQQKSIEQLLD
ncbi:DNA mismatch repair protein MutL, partial [Parabacteroides distasonis]